MDFEKLSVAKKKIVSSTEMIVIEQPVVLKVCYKTQFEIRLDRYLPAIGITEIVQASVL